MKIQLNSVNDVKAFVHIASRHTYNVYLRSGAYSVDGKSVMGVFSLDLSQPVECEFEYGIPNELAAELKPYIRKG